MPVLVISDVHGNLAALEAVLADAGAVDAVWVLGDMVGYGPQPNQVVARLAELGARCVAGNHEWAALGRMGVEEFNPAAAEAARWTAAKLNPAIRRYLEGLPIRWTSDDGSVTTVHGSPRDPIWEYVFSDGVARENFAHFQTPLCFVGHTHVPAVFGQTADGRLLHGPDVPLPAGYRVVVSPGVRYLLNPGSVGQPRDGDPRAAYLLFDPLACTAEWRRVAYAIGDTQRLMKQAGLPAALWQRLALGR